MADDRRVLVIDDDPTGTQTVSGLRIALRPGRDMFDEFFAGPERVLFVLSNSRALDRAAAAALVARIAADARAAAGGHDLDLILRGDSTLRGHVFAETDAVDPTAPVLFVPAFPPGGRITVDGVHYLSVDGERVPVGRT
ncbi:MAG: four-carbon acid sugar kinase family protein, partial [Actinomycetota bacterium]|nr:four-carbon acid sugar kinase family protein [Actinomycetota bacterium]